jgi:hypothetical protein
MHKRARATRASNKTKEHTVEDELTSSAGSHDHTAFLGLDILVHTELSDAQILVLAIYDGIQLGLDFKHSLLTLLTRTTVDQLRLGVIRHLFVVAVFLLVRGVASRD